MKSTHKILLALCVSCSLSANNPEPQNKPPQDPHLVLQADLLYWVPEVSGLESNFGRGSSTSTTSNGVTTLTSTEKDVDPSCHWNAGYRLGLGWQFDRSSWDLGGAWTYFQGSGRKRKNRGKWKVRLEQIDLAAEYKASLSTVLLKPFIGIRGTSILQKLFSQINNEIVFSGLGTATDTRVFHDRQQFYGLGPLFGLHSNYAMKHGISLYGDIGFSVLYGTYHLRFHDRETLTSPATPTQIYSHVQKNMKAFDLNLDLALGIEWETWMYEKCLLNLKLGLENHQYFQQSRLGYTLGNLSFSGGILSVGLAF